MDYDEGGDNGGGEVGNGEQTDSDKFRVALQLKKYRLSGLFVSMPFDLEIGLLICELFWYDAF